MNDPALFGENVTVKVVDAPAASVVEPKPVPNANSVPVTVIGLFTVSEVEPVLVIVNIAVVVDPSCVLANV